jgi:hypothetical protein
MPYFDPQDKFSKYAARFQNRILGLVEDVKAIHSEVQTLLHYLGTKVEADLGLHFWKSQILCRR